MRLSDEAYANVLRALPIACVDLLVTNRLGEVLLVRRRNPPAANEWWFPGGRVLIGERREAAAYRKLSEECGLRAHGTRDLGTYDLILPLPDGGISHAVTTVFHLLADDGQVQLDAQSSEFAWRTAAAWRGAVRADFVSRILDEHADKKG
jgi:ADP-ribose pyrophosphatase YjhB (NUDIX family)